MKNLITQLKDEVKMWQDSINSQQPIICSHLICPQCQAEIERRNTENEILMARINDKVAIINKIETIKI